MAADDTVPTISCRIYIMEPSTKAQFLVDTGSDLCVLPRTLVREPREKSSHELSAANGTPIATYGTTTMTLNFWLRRDFTWRFVVTDVTKPIIGVDFLAHYDLLADVRNWKLIVATTHLSASRKSVTEKTPCENRHRLHTISRASNQIPWNHSSRWNPNCETQDGAFH